VEGGDEYVPRKRTPLERIAEPIVSSRAGSWWYVHVAPRLDRPLLRATRGRLSTAGFGRVGLLSVRGAKTGTLRETPLVYARDGNRVILVGSRGGSARHPLWYRNLVANPEVGFAAQGDERRYQARTTEGAERERAWRLACDRYAGYLVYEKRAGERQIPVVVLEPVGTDAGPQDP
jgi:deazaflavin-dependent oxidoreductase (nitroreductase family)